MEFYYKEPGFIKMLRFQKWVRDEMREAHPYHRHVFSFNNMSRYGTYLIGRCGLCYIEATYISMRGWVPLPKDHMKMDVCEALRIAHNSPHTLG